MRRVLSAALLVAALATPGLARADKVYGALVLDEARRIAPGRYESRKDLDRTMRFFRSVYGRKDGYVIRRLSSVPGVKGFHIANLRRGRTWDGINVYEHKRDVIIYVLKAAEAKDE